MSTLEFPAPSLADSSLLEPPALPFKLLHIERADELDQQDKRAFNVWLELSGLVEVGSPCLYFLAPTDARCGFALAQHAPKTHINQLLMLLVDQDNVYEALSAFEERVRARARRLLAAEEPAPSVAADEDFGVEPPADPGEPPEWMLEPPPEAYDPGNEVPDYGDLG